MNLKLPPDAEALFNERANALLPLVVARVSTPPTQPDTASVPDDDRAQRNAPAAPPGVVHCHTDPNGLLQGWFLRAPTGDIGLDGADYRQLRLLAEDLQQRAELRPHLSVSAVERGVFWWVLERHAGRSDLPLLAYLLPRAARVVVERVVFVPIFGLVLDSALTLGHIALRPLTREFFDRWDEVAATADRSLVTEIQHHLRDFRRELQGAAVGMLRVDAEPVRARERALAEAEQALALLRVFQPQMRHPLLRSYLRPRGREAVEHAQVFVGQANPAVPPILHTGERGSVAPWILDRRTLKQIEAGGLHALRDLYLVDEKTPFQQAVLDAVLLYARSSLHPELTGRLTWVLTALEFVLLRDADGPTHDTIAARMAVVVSTSHEERLPIKQRVVAAYDLRARHVQDPPMLRDVDLLEAFLADVFRFFVLLIGRHQRYPTLATFIESLDQHTRG